MNEVSGRGLYPGPHQQYRCHKTVYGNTVWQRSTPQALARTTQHGGQHDDQHRPESSGQEHQARGIDGKSLTELLGLRIAKYGRPTAFAEHIAEQEPFLALPRIPHEPQLGDLDLGEVELLRHHLDTSVEMEGHHEI